MKILLCLVACTLLIAGCGKPSNQSVQKENSAASDLKVALLSPGPVNDNGWNALGYEGLKKVKEELGAQISQKQTKGPADFEADFREYASQGYDVIIGHGYELQPAAIKISKDFPDTVFVITAGTDVAGKVVPIIPKLEEATYLLGVMAARMSKTGKAGLIGGMEIPPIKSTFDAFKKGALSVNPDFSVRSAFLGNWDDTAAAKEQAKTLINEGCDMIFHNADAAGRGVFEAVAESKGVWAFGSNSNQNDLSPDVILASAVLEIPQQFVEICRSVEDGSFKPQKFVLNVENGHTTLQINPELKSKIPAEVLKEIDTLTGKLKDGSLVVDRAHF